MIFKVITGLVLFETVHLLAAILLTGPSNRENFKRCYLMAFNLIASFLLGVLVIYGCIAILAS